MGGGGGGGGGRKGQRVGNGGGCGTGRRPLPLQLGGMGERCKLLGLRPRSFASSDPRYEASEQTEFHTETATKCFMPLSCANCACARVAAALGLTFVRRTTVHFLSSTLQLTVTG